jgi:hypothetical protein
VPRRLASLAALVLVVGLAAGCADDAPPAARVGDSLEISNEDLLDEVAEWAQSPQLLQQVGIADAEGAAPGSYATPLVDVVLTNRIRFDLHREQFDALGLSEGEVDPTLQQQLATVLDEVSPAFGDRLVADLMRVQAVSEAMGDEYEDWFAEVTGGDVEISSRYGTWDRSAAAVVGPQGPRPAPGGGLIEL